MRPSARNSTWSAKAAELGSWVTMTIVWPYSSTERRMKPSSSLPAAESRLLRLVGEHDRRLGGQRPGRGHPLLLAAGQLRRLVAEVLLAQADGVDHLVEEAVARSGLRPAMARGSLDVLGRGQVDVAASKAWNTKPTLSRRSRGERRTAWTARRRR